MDGRCTWVGDDPGRESARPAPRRAVAAAAGVP